MKFLGFLFDTESKFGKIMTKIGIVVVANLLFLVCSIPIITIGASYTALSYVMLKEFRVNNDTNPFKQFWYGFRNNFKQATLCWIVVLILYGLGYIEVKWCAYMGGFFINLQFALQIIGVFGVVICIYVFQSIAAFANSIRNLLKNSIYFIFEKPLIAITIGICNLIPVTITKLDEANQGTYVFMWFFFGFALFTMISSWLLLKVFTKYLPN